ncbi:MAG TPA: hypothetical protein VK013_00470 [Myxococcaceae bacterium]|nr:hypothetical protein [Myxococcaceae bacterium]
MTTTHPRPQTFTADAAPLSSGLRRLDVGSGSALWSLAPYDAQGRPQPAVVASLRALLAEPGAGVRRVVLGLEGEPWGSQEERHRLTRTVLELLVAHAQVDLQVHTRTSLVARDADLLRRLSEKGRATVAFTVASLDERVNAWLEPGAPSALRRMMAMQALAHTGVVVGLRLAPLLPGTLEGCEALLARAAHAGARFVELGPVGLTPASAQLLEARASSGAARPRALRRLHLRTGEAERLRRVVAEKAMAVGLLPLDAELPVTRSAPAEAPQEVPVAAAVAEARAFGKRRKSVAPRRSSWPLGPATQLALFAC